MEISAPTSIKGVHHWSHPTNENRNLSGPPPKCHPPFRGKETLRPYFLGDDGGLHDPFIRPLFLRGWWWASWSLHKAGYFLGVGMGPLDSHGMKFQLLNPAVFIWKNQAFPGWYCWWFRNPANQLRLVVYPIIYTVLAPSQVVVWDFFHQQYVRFIVKLSLMILSTSPIWKKKTN